uniref:tRNA (Adenine(58)-N(1))-methyltransferase TrmI-like n=1 Tax=Petromyzon marinus TaxID=7757 RepID=A0AAJ7TXY1_PETMA|nr:tRNA (adenine(58)-N(1))-methyltransferase TrmI-like [Petromyzon marinus]
MMAFPLPLVPRSRMLPPHPLSGAARGAVPCPQPHASPSSWVPRASALMRSLRDRRHRAKAAIRRMKRNLTPASKAWTRTRNTDVSAMLMHLDLRPGDVVLEAGSGSGAMMLMLSGAASRRPWMWRPPFGQSGCR